MNKQNYPKNFIPGFTISQDTDNVTAGTVDREQVKESSAAQKLFVRAGLIGLLVPTPKAIDDSAKQLLCGSLNTKKHNRIERSHTIDVLSDKYTAAGVSDGRRATFSDIHKTETVSDPNHKERTVKDLQKAHKILSNNNLLVRGPSAYGKRKEGVVINKFEDQSASHILRPEFQRLSNSDKRRSRSFSAGIDSVEKIKPENRPASTEFTRRKGKSVCAAVNSRENEERKTMAEMQEVLRSKLPKTFQATACMALIGPAALAEKRKYSHVKASPKNSLSSTPMRERVNSIPWLKNIKSELTKEHKVTSSNEKLHKTVSNGKEHDHSKHRRGNFKLFGKKSKSLSLDHSQYSNDNSANNSQNNSEDEIPNTKNNEKPSTVTSHMVYIPRSASLPQDTVLKSKASVARDRLSSSSNDSGINFNVHEDSSSEDDTRKLKRQSQRSFKQIYLTPTPEQKRMSTVGENIQGTNMTLHDSQRVRKVSVGLRKMSMGRPPAVHRVSFKISERVSLIKLTSPTENSETKFFSLPKRPHSYLRGIREDISKDLRENYLNSFTLPTRRHRPALIEELFHQNTDRESPI